MSPVVALRDEWEVMRRTSVWKWGVRVFETAQDDGCIETDDRLILKNRPQWSVWERLQVWPRTERNSNPGLPHCESDALTTRLRCLLNRTKLACARASSLFRVASEESRERVDLLQSCLLSRVALAWLLATPPKGELARKLKKVEASLFLSPPRNNKYNRQHHKNMKILLFKFTKKIYRSR